MMIQEYLNFLFLPLLLPRAAYLMEKYKHNLPSLQGTVFLVKSSLRPKIQKVEGEQRRMNPVLVWVYVSGEK